MHVPIVPIEGAEESAAINVIVVSPNNELREELQERLGLPRWNLLPATSGVAALALLREHGDEEAVLLLDPMLPDLEPIEFDGLVRDRFPNVQVLMLN